MVQGMKGFVSRRAKDTGSTGVGSKGNMAARNLVITFLSCKF